MTSAASRKTRPDSIMIGRCQGEDTFVTIQPMGILRFRRNGVFTFSKDIYNPPIYLGPHPQPSQAFRFALAS